MKYLLGVILLISIIMTPVFAQETKNPSLKINTVEIPWFEFNKVARDASIIELRDLHAISWQVTIDNNLAYANPNGNAVLRLYDSEISDKFIEIGMGANPDEKFWVAVQLPKEGYVVVHSKLERGWIPEAKVIASYTDRGGLTVNNGERIVVTNLDVDRFAIDSYSTHGMEGSTDPPATNSGIMEVEFLSGNPSENMFSLFPFFLTAAIGGLAGALYITKKRSS